MPIFETDQDRSNEQRIGNYFVKCLGNNYSISPKLNYKDIIDRALLRNNQLVAWLEIKHRNQNYYTSQGLEISLHKIKIGIDYLKATKNPFILIIEFENLIKYANIKENALQIFNTYFGGRKNPRPNAPNDREMVVEIPIDEFQEVRNAKYLFPEVYVNPSHII